MNDIRVSMRDGRQGKRRAGHPWIYKTQLRKVPVALKPGDIVTVTTSSGVFIGRGYYNSHSEIAVRLLTFHDEPIIAIDVHVPGSVIALPRDEDVASSPRLAHSDMLPHRVTLCNGPTRPG